MRALTEEDAKATFVNADADELRVMAFPLGFLLADWDHLDFYAWRDPRTRSRGYLVAEVDGHLRGVVLRAADGNGRARSALCNICHTMQPADQVSLFTARKSGAQEGSVGTYICADMSCHENVRRAMPLAPSEVRASVDKKIDGARHRAQSFVESVAS